MAAFRIASAQLNGCDGAGDFGDAIGAGGLAAAGGLTIGATIGLAGVGAAGLFAIEVASTLVVDRTAVDACRLGAGAAFFAGAGFVVAFDEGLDAALLAGLAAAVFFVAGAFDLPTALTATVLVFSLLFAAGLALVLGLLAVFAFVMSRLPVVHVLQQND